METSSQRPYVQSELEEVFRSQHLRKGEGRKINRKEERKINSSHGTNALPGRFQFIDNFLNVWIYVRQG